MPGSRKPGGGGILGSAHVPWNQICMVPNPSKYLVCAYLGCYGILGSSNSPEVLVYIVAAPQGNIPIGSSEVVSAKTVSAIDVGIDDAGSILKFRIG